MAGPSLPDNPLTIAEMDLESLALLMLQILKGIGVEPRTKTPNVNRVRQSALLSNVPGPAEDPNYYPARLAVLEALNWLETRELIAQLDIEFNAYFVTRLGYTVDSKTDLQGLLNARLLPKGFLHYDLCASAWPAFIRGDLDTAVFSAFKAVEIAVRDAGGFAKESVGVDLMRQAFHANTGPLRDANAPVAEREALSHLFAGSAGYFRNPTAHQDVHLTDPHEAMEMIVFASHLLRITEQRKLARGQ